MPGNRVQGWKNSWKFEEIMAARELKERGPKSQYKPCSNPWLTVKLLVHEEELMKLNGKPGRDQRNLLLKDRSAEGNCEFAAFITQSIPLNMR